MKKICLFMILGVLLFAGFPGRTSAQGTGDEHPGVQTLPDGQKVLFVYYDKGDPRNSYFPSHTIGDGKALKFDDGCPDDPQSGKTCVKITYNATGSYGWAGLYWVNPPGNWGDEKGGYDLSFAKKLTFWARGEKGGEHIAVFRFGGLKGDYPDSDIHGVGPLVLTKEWKQYSVNLEGRNMRYIFAGFSFALTKEYNREGCVFYVDNIKYE